MNHLKSIIEPIIKKVYEAKTLEEGKEIMLGLISETKIKEQDKTKMIYEVKKCPTLVKLQFYATNCMFKFEGLSTNSVIYK